VNINQETSRFGSIQGVQQAFLRGSEGLQLNHLVPEGHACSWPGREVVAGKDIKERKVRISAGTWFHDTKFT
jgi:hypothetical protein